MTATTIHAPITNIRSVHNVSKWSQLHNMWQYRAYVMDSVSSGQAIITSVFHLLLLIHAIDSKFVAKVHLAIYLCHVIHPCIAIYYPYAPCIHCVPLHHPNLVSFLFIPSLCSLYSLVLIHRIFHLLVYTVQSFIKTFLLKCYCLSLYGCCIWSLCAPSLHVIIYIEIALNKIWHLPACSHTGIVHCVAKVKTISNLLYHRFHSFISRAL